jgi:hypothetical protein
VAHEILESKGIRSMMAAVTIENDCVLPPAGACEEPAWLEALRREDFTDDMAWTEQMDDDITDIKAFQCRLESLSLNLVNGRSQQDTPYYVEIDDTKALLLLLEGLDWQ